MSVARFKVTQKNVTPQGVNIQLDVAVPGSPENDDFFAASPTGKITLGMVEPAVASGFAVGAEFLVDFSAV